MLKSHFICLGVSKIRIFSYAEETKIFCLAYTIILECFEEGFSFPFFSNIQSSS